MLKILTEKEKKIFFGCFENNNDLIFQNGGNNQNFKKKLASSVICVNDTFICALTNIRFKGVFWTTSYSSLFRWRTRCESSACWAWKLWSSRMQLEGWMLLLTWETSCWSRITSTCRGLRGRTHSAATMMTGETPALLLLNPFCASLSDVF